MDSKTILLDYPSIKQRLKRMAYEIAENNYDEEELILVGIKGDGYLMAKIIAKHLRKIGDFNIKLEYIRINKRKPTDELLECSFDAKNLHGKNIVVIDDVANTGRTILYVIKPLMEYIPRSIQVAVLIDRKHKLFPICSDYVGLMLSTTMKENVKVDFSDTEAIAYLE